MPKDDWAKYRRKDIARREKNRRYFAGVNDRQRRARKNWAVKKYLYRLVLPVGSEVSVCRESDSLRSWIPHVTTRRLEFVSPDESHGGAVVFRQQGWLILTRWSVLKRERIDLT